MTSEVFIVEFDEDQIDSDEVSEIGGWAPRVGENFSRLTQVQENKLQKVSMNPSGSLDLWSSEVHRVASRCVDPGLKTSPLTVSTQLVVGRIQAGKTGNFTGLMALLADNLYPFFIVVAGTSKNLRDQTAVRLADDLGHFNFSFVTTGEGPYGKQRMMLQEEMERTLLDWHEAVEGGLEFPKPICITVLKSTKSHLDFVNDVLESIGSKESTRKILERTPFLIVDDECDSASPNGNVNLPDEERAATNAALVRMRNALPFHTYVGYTATPQAQILMDIEDVLKPERVTNLEAGEDYVGVETLFTRDSKFPSEIAVWDPTQKVPNSLKVAFGHFVVQSYLFHHPDKEIRSRFISPPLLEDPKAIEKPVSMLVHVDRSVTLSREVHRSIESLRQQWIKTLRIKRSSSGAMEGSQRTLFEKFLLPALKSFGIEELADDPSFFGQLRNELIGTEARLVISEKVGGDAYPSEEEFKNKRAWILVGAVLLDRGQTLPNLVNTYLARSSGGGAKGREAGGNIDTLLQRGRFFGHRKQYLPLLRGFFSPSTMASYEEIATLEPIWRSALARLDKANLDLGMYPIVLELSATSPKLAPVRKQIIPKSVKSVRSNGWFLRESWVSEARSSKNLELLQFRLRNEWAQQIENTSDWIDKHFSFSLSWSDAIGLIRDWEVDLGDKENQALSLEILDYLEPRLGSNGIKVLLMNRKKLGEYSPEPTYLRKVQRESGSSFQTAGLLSFTDRKYVAQGMPTIQVHFLRVVGKGSIDLVARGAGLGLHVRDIAYVRTGDPLNG